MNSTINNDIIIHVYYSDAANIDMCEKKPPHEYADTERWWKEISGMDSYYLLHYGYGGRLASQREVILKL